MIKQISAGYKGQKPYCVKSAHVSGSCFLSTHDTIYNTVWSTEARRDCRIGPRNNNIIIIMFMGRNKIDVTSLEYCAKLH